MILNKKNINDLNSLVEVYIEWFLKNKFNVEKVGHIFESPDIGIYYIHNPKTDMYCVMTTNYSKYNDKRIKKQSTRYRKSTTFFFPTTESMLKRTDKSYEETLRFLGMGERDSEIYFRETNDFEFIQNLLDLDLDL